MLARAVLATMVLFCPRLMVLALRRNLETVVNELALWIEVGEAVSPDVSILVGLGEFFGCYTLFCGRDYV